MIVNEEQHNHWRKQTLEENNEYAEAIKQEDFKKIKDYAATMDTQLLLRNLNDENLRMESKEFYSYILNLYTEVFLTVTENR